MGVVVLFLLTMSLSGCLSWGESSANSTTDEVTYPSIWDRHTLEWGMEHSHSFTLEPGPYQALEVQEAYIEVDTSEVWETGPSQSTVHLSYWLPNNTLDGEQVPVIAVISPYFSYGQQGDESTPTNIVGGAVVNLSLIISFHTAMPLHKSQYLAQNSLVDVLIIVEREKVGAFITQLSGLVPKIGVMVTWVFTVNHMRALLSGKQQQ